MTSGAAAARRRIAGHEAALVERAARADARLGRRRDRRPTAARRRRRSGSSARSPVGDDAANASSRSSSGSRDQRSLPVAFAQAPPADVVRQALHHRPLERRGQQAGAVEHRPQARQVDAGDLVLQRLGAGADHHLAPRQQRRAPGRRASCRCRCRPRPAGARRRRSPRRSARPSPAARAAPRSRGTAPPRPRRVRAMHGCPAASPRGDRRQVRATPSLLAARLFVDARHAEPAAQLREHVVDRHARRLQARPARGRSGRPPRARCGRASPSSSASVELAAPPRRSWR